MKNVAQSELFVQLEKHLSGKGCFLVTGKDQPNFMTIGWATAGIMWEKPVVMVAVRLSRYTHEKLDACKEFTICIPKDGELTKELAFAGVKSGRAFDKAAELNFRYLPAEKNAVPQLDRCSAAYECRVNY